MWYEMVNIFQRVPQAAISRLEYSWAALEPGGQWSNCNWDERDDNSLNVVIVETMWGGHTVCFRTHTLFMIFWSCQDFLGAWICNKRKRRAKDFTEVFYLSVGEDRVSVTWDGENYKKTKVWGWN